MLATLTLLFLAAFAGATLLPLSSEVAFGATILANPANAMILLLVATVGNSLGITFNFFLGRGLLRLRLFQKLIDNPKDIGTLTALIRAALSVKDYPLARLLSLRAIELDEKNAEVQNLLGVASFNSNMGQAAADAFKKALRINSKYAPAQANLGGVWGIMRVE